MTQTQGVCLSTQRKRMTTHLQPQQITKLGIDLLIYNKVRGVCLKEVDKETFLISMSNAGVNWSEEVNIKDIQL